MIHRDLKPSYVLLAHDGPRVIDFGIARARAETPMTRSEVTMGSPDFMSPEQILDLPVTPAIDVFALGSLAAFAAVGRLPFGHGHITAVASRVVHEPPDLAGCPARLVPLIRACLEKEPTARPAPGQILEFCVARTASPPALVPRVIRPPTTRPPRWDRWSCCPRGARPPHRRCSRSHGWRPTPSTGISARAGQATLAIPSGWRSASSQWGYSLFEFQVFGR